MQIGAVGAQSLATVLETNKVLEHLALNNCNLGDDGVEPIANGVMKILTVSYLLSSHISLLLDLVQFC